MAFIAQVADFICNNYDLQKDRLTVVFPNKRAALFLRNEFTNRISRNVWLPKIVSVQEAMTEWSGLQIIDNIDVIFEILKISSKFHNNGEVNSEFFGLAAQMAKDFDEIDLYAVDAKTLFRHLSEAKAVEAWTPNDDSEIERNYVKFFESLYSYYEELKKSLEKMNHGYYGMITRKLYELSQDMLEAKVGAGKVIFAGFNAMALTEEAIIVRLVEGKKADILWDIDSYYFTDERQEAGFFAREFAARHPEIPIRFINNKFASEKKEINIIEASGASVQANALQLMLNAENHDGTKSEAVVLADESLLIPVLNSIPESCGSMKVTMGYPFRQAEVYKFVIQQFRFQKSLSGNSDKVYLWNFIKITNSEIVKIIFDKEILLKLKQWQDSLLRNSIYYVEKSHFDELSQNGDLQKFLVLCSKKWNSPADCLFSLKELLIFIGRHLKPDNYFIKNQVSCAGRIVNRLEKLMQKYDGFIQTTDLDALFEQMSNETSIRLQGDSGGIQVMGLLETRNIDFDIIHLLSLNEGTLPKSKRANSLIPFDLRKHYRLPSYAQQQAVYSYHFYRLLQNAQSINLYYNSLADGMGQGEPSRYIRQLLFEYAKKNKDAAIQRLCFESPQISADRDGKVSAPKTPEIMEKLMDKISDSGLSPTSLSTFLNCPLQFYLKYIEKIEDNTIEENIQVNVIGSIIHDTLDNLYQCFGNKIITSDIYESTVNERLKECHLKALANNGFVNGLPDTGFNYLTKNVIDNMLSNFIASEKEFIKSVSSMQIKALETELSYDGLACNGQNIKLSGRADRIDLVDGKIRVIDYKTGLVEDTNVKVGKDHTDLFKMQEKAIQLMIYKYLYVKMNGDVNPDDVVPGIIALQKLSHGLFTLNIDKDHDFNLGFVDSFEDYLIDAIGNLLDTEQDFIQAEDESHCKYCDFKVICKR